MNSKTCVYLSLIVCNVLESSQKLLLMAMSLFILNACASRWSPSRGWCSHPGQRLKDWWEFSHRGVGSCQKDFGQRPNAAVRYWKAPTPNLPPLSSFYVSSFCQGFTETSYLSPMFYFGRWATHLMGMKVPAFSAMPAHSDKPVWHHFKVHFKTCHLYCFAVRFQQTFLVW